jgi:hypothetical protein
MRVYAMKTTTTPTVKFSAVEIEMLQFAARQVWEEIAYDCLVALAEEQGKHVDAVTMPRAHVIEVALDAGRVEDLLQRHMLRKWEPSARKDFLARLEQAPYKQLIKLVTPAFSYSRYGT